MNRQNVWTLYDTLVSLRGTKRERRFRMDGWIVPTKDPETQELFSEITADPFKCGTAACLMGWACMIAHEQDPKQYRVMNVEIEARRWLGLDGRQTTRWAMGYWHPGRRSEKHSYGLGMVTLDDALVFLRKVLETPDADVDSVTLFTEDLPNWETDMFTRLDRMVKVEYADT